MSDSLADVRFESSYDLLPRSPPRVHANLSPGPAPDLEVRSRPGFTRTKARYTDGMRLCILFLGLSGALACARSPHVVYAVPDLEVPPDGEADPVAVAAIPEDGWAHAPAVTHVQDVVYTDPGELPRFEHAGAALPLRSTAVRAHLRGPIAEVVVTQRFVNDHDTAIEAVYTFPLPENSAVDRMRMVLGERVIEAEIRERGQARAEYQQAAAAGHTAALLEQERPNIFTQSVANIPPGQTIDVEVRYLQTLTYDAGEYEFVFPTVVGPRYIPGSPVSRQDSGGGRASDTPRVPDASRITPPILGHGQRTGNDLTIEVIAEAGSKISDWAAPAHDVRVLATGDRLHVELAPHDRIPNRDFVLRYRSAGARPTARMFVAPAAGGSGGHFMLLAEPPRLDVDALVGRRELVFVVDVSGSMGGTPLALAKAAMREALAGVRPVDTFQVFTFSGHPAQLFAAPRPATADNIRVAQEFVDGLSAGGGTEMRDAVAAALGSAVGEGRHRYVFFLTDGNTGEEDAIAHGAAALVARQRRHGARARVFGVGIGASPNSHLIAVLSKSGEGVPLAIHRPVEVSRAVQTFERIIDAPVVTDVAIAWDTIIKVDAVYPTVAPDLFASRPLIVQGRYTGQIPANPTITLRGAVGPRSVTIPVAVTPVGERTDILAALWARARVDELDLTRVTTDDPTVADNARKEILGTGLDYHLVTAFTSLVAIDRSSRQTGPQHTIVQPVEPVEGIDIATYGTTVGSAISMETLRSIPMGGTARDFTSVVEVAPTATRDSAGIRLSGTTGAETKYIVDGANITPSTLVPGAILHITDSPQPRWTGLPLVPSASTRIHAISAASPTVAAALRDNLKLALPDLDQCFLASPREHHRIRRKLRLQLRIAAAGDLAELHIHTATPLDADTTACIRKHLDVAVRDAATPPGALNIDLRVWMRT
jgi:Ca-activated chloride channel family protein